MKQPIKEIEYEILCDDLQRISDAIDLLEPNEGERYRELIRMKNQIIADLEVLNRDLTKKVKKLTKSNDFLSF